MVLFISFVHEMLLTLLHFYCNDSQPVSYKSHEFNQIKK